MSKEQFRNSFNPEKWAAIDAGSSGLLVPRTAAQLNGESLLTPRELEWKQAYADVQDTPGGTARYANGQPYDFDPGISLNILGEPVMHTCETPWSVATVRNAFAAYNNLHPTRHNRERKRVLERGFGLGITGRSIVLGLGAEGGGQYDVIELNDQVANYAENRWAPKAQAGFQSIGDEQPATIPEIDINVIRGEAAKETRRLVEEGAQYDIFVSDTYPLTKKKAGINDIEDAEVIREALVPGGILTFFMFQPGHKRDGLSEQQEALLGDGFRIVNMFYVPVKPYPGYPYLHHPRTKAPVTKLPVIICVKQ
jgi:hypothetical protein